LPTCPFPKNDTENQKESRGEEYVMVLPGAGRLDVKKRAENVRPMIENTSVEGKGNI
jgi:hypothetical protein